MRWLVYICLAFVWQVSAALAQSSDADRGYIQAFLEDSLSGAGRDVRIIGFEGALSSSAKIQELSIADADGIWVTLDGAVLNWNRGALLRGRLEIEELSAATLRIERLPIQAPTEANTGAFGLALPQLPSPEANPFSLPDLPVSVQIDKLSIGTVALGPSILGEAVTLSVNGAARLNEGEGTADLTLLRQDGPEGRFVVRGGFSNRSRELDLALILEDAADGIVSNLLGIPGRPSVALQVAGKGPVENYTANIGLATDGVDRVSGNVTLTTGPQGAQQFAAEIGGDLRALMQDQYHAFLGSDVRLSANGTRPADGGVRLDQFALEADALDLEGAITIDPTGWPALFDIQGRVSSKDNTAMLLALPGPETRVRSIVIDAQYDAQAADTWKVDLGIEQLDRPGVTVSQVAVKGIGQLIPGDGTLAGQALGQVTLNLNGLQPADAALSQALGKQISGKLAFDYRENTPLTLQNLDLRGEDFSLTGNAQLNGAVQSADLGLNGAISLIAQDLSRFAALAQRDLTGAAQLDIDGSVALLNGGFDLLIAGGTRELTVGVDQLDPILAGQGSLEMAVARDENGTKLRRLQIRTPQANLSAQADLSTEVSSGQFKARVTEAAVIDPAMQGTATLEGAFRQTGENLNLDVSATGPGQTTATLTGQARVTDGVLGALVGQATVAAENLSAYAGLAGREIAGSVQLTAMGEANLRTGDFAGQLDGVMRDLVTGQAEADLLFSGESRLTAQLRRLEDGMIVIDDMTLATPRFAADTTGSYSADRSRIRFRVDLDDVALYAPDLSGPLEAEGILSSQGGPWLVSSAVQGPGGMSGQLEGDVAQDASQANLNFRGTAPLALANRFITPNLAFGAVSYDLTLNGPIGLSAVSGSVRVADAQVALSTSGISLSDVSATAGLSGGRAQIESTANVDAGGRIQTSGTLVLSAPFQADLQAVLASVAVADPGIYETAVDGQINMRGPLQGGASIQGRLSLDTVEIRVPDGVGASGTALPGIIHRNEPPAVRQTRARAGLIGTNAAGGSAAYPLDIVVDAPSRIFVRGRGLDAELGGALRLRGTTENVIPEGRFELIRGRLDILGKRLELSEAIAQLQGDFDPFLRVVADTTADGTIIQFIIEGLVSELGISITSSPELPDDEILSRLLFGRGLTQISALQALQLASAIQTLAGRGGDGIVEKLRKNFGLDDLDVSTSETGETGVRVGKYITENIYSDVTVDSSGKSEINLNLSITPSLTGRGSFGSDGDTGVGIFFERDY